MIDKIRAAQEHYERGNGFDAGGNTARAIEEWRRAIQLNPNYFDAHYNLGIAYADEGDLSRAVDELELAHALDPDDVDARRELAQVLIERAEEFFAASNLNGVIDDCNRALESDPQNAVAHFYLAQTYPDPSHYKNAEQHLRAAIKLNPFYTAAYAQLADIYLEQERGKDALDILRNALSIHHSGSFHTFPFGGNSPPVERTPFDKSVSDLARKLAKLELANGNPDQAMAALEQAAPEKENAGLWRRLVKEFAVRGDSESAELANSRAAELEQQDASDENPPDEEIKLGVADVHAERGEELYDKGDVEEARKEWQEATQLNPDQLDAHYNLGLSYQKEEEYDLAEKEFREVLRIDSSDADARFGLGEIFDERQDWQSAIREYREVLRLAPDDKEAQENLIWDLLEINNLGEAQVELQRGNLEPSASADLWTELGKAYEERGAQGNAILAYQRALELNKKQSNARAGLKRLGVN